MGDVIALPRTCNVATRASESGSAEILFFTGVRYYRLSDEDFARLTQPRVQPRARRSAKLKINSEIDIKTAAQAQAPASRKLKRHG